MEDVDDDFGDLYADVEVEASSAMNVAPQFSQLQFVSDETGKRNSALEASSDKEDRVSDGDEDDDDDDDDLNIVLNSDDDSVRHGEGLTISRTNTNLRSGELEDEDDDNIGKEEIAGGKAVGNSHSLYKYSRSQSAAYGSESKGNGSVPAAYLSREDNGYSQRSMGPQHAQRFSLPWSRSILDVNIDVFEQKPWKHPGADITDYFNFGLNEDTWKLYCNQVDEYRHRGPMSSGSPVSEPTQLIEMKGRAIQVEDSIVERQSSMDIRRQLDRDSDVIQITIVDPEEHCCESVKEGSGNLETSVPEASTHGDVSGDDRTDHLSFSSSSEDESFEGNHLETDIDALKRGSNGRSRSKPVTQDSKKNEIHQCSGGTDEAIKTSDNTKERTGEDTCTTDLSIMPAESSEAEKSPKNHCKSFEDRWKSYSHERCSSTELTRSRKPGYHHSEGLKISDKYHRYHSRCHSPVYNDRTRKDSKPKYHHENDDIIFSRRRDEERKHREHRYRGRHSTPVYNHRTYDYERLHPFDPYNEEGMLYSKESEPPLDYYHGERFSEYERFGPKMGRPVFRRLEEEEYYDEQRRYTNEFGKRKGNNVHFGHKGIHDEFFLEREYSQDIKGENFRSFAYNDDMEKDEYEHVNHEAYTRWEFRGSGRNERKVGSPSSELNNPLPNREESHINNGRWHDDMMPRSSLYGRQRRYEEGELSERFRYDDSEPFDYTVDYDDRVDVVRSRDHHWQPEMQMKDDDIMIPFDDAYIKRHKYKFERASNVKYEGSHEKRFQGRRDPDITHGGSYEWVFMNSHMVDGSVHVDDLKNAADGCGGYKRKREVISGKKYGESGKKPSPSCRNSCLVVREGKSSKRLPTKAIHQRQHLDIEEGQILDTGPTKDENGSHNQKEKTGLDKSRILEARAKMEKRRARFNETTKMESDNTTTAKKVGVGDLFQEKGSNKPQRPPRKRRWGGS
ncbi:FIP1[III]-like protein isoform X1 [Lactuca sativa]|uniref:Pre-mRNA polyadenylation factor Fip1 domain-containing protein n=1 Tax=Lactuca sativa TaxID=4236 RepID=A0A9R1V8E9_LACSA|nr:FIP1[III]-like protein isoform X1 [Lactuca sativa]XP_023765691.1 FIP1[III]-like protein isoform X1 [Lactuca sativa]XP_023765692.1 FIP1[III]-like protein isoform X1 [Lactuca sativa]KAJ0202267.1 hypothetical protein LSAT_V11C600341700 [Lactuca sativa]